MEGSFPYDPSFPTEEVSKAIPLDSINEALPKQLEERGKPETKSQKTPLTSLIGSNWSSLPVRSESESPIQPGQKSNNLSPTKTMWKVQQRGLDGYERDRLGKYAEYFKGNEILPIPKIVQKLEPRILSLIVTDIKTRRLVGLKKEGFEDLLRKAGVP